MKKMVILIGLFVLSVLVIGCTQGTLAGEASGTKSKVACPVLPISVGSPDSSDVVGPVPSCENPCGTLVEGTSDAYRIGTAQYLITLTDILYQDAGSIQEATFHIVQGGTSTDSVETYQLSPEETTSLSGGRSFTVINILYQDFAGGVRSAGFCLT